MFKENILAIKKPELIKQWHPSKNGNLTPYDVTFGESRKVWWICDKNNEHEWEAKICNRSTGTGCPFCTGQKVSKENSLATINPELAKQWHPEKNGDLSPHDVSAFSHKNVWWKCNKGIKSVHEWQAIIKNRHMQNQDCPFCVGKKVCKDNCLLELRPDIAEQWHPTKNKNLSPNDVTCGSHKVIWWQCNRGHEWTSTVKNRVAGNSCPKCDKSRTSFSEQAILFYLLEIFPNVENQFKTDLKFKKNYIDLDIFIPETRIAIEYDGSYYHKDKLDQDIEKTKKLLSNDYKLIRIRDHTLPDLYVKGCIIIKNDDSRLSNLDFTIRLLFDTLLELNFSSKLFDFLRKVKINTKKDRVKILEMFLQKQIKNSIAEQCPHLINEWHPTKNGDLLPSYFSKGSNTVVWWKCSKGHEWETPIHTRAIYNRPCPYCTGVLPTKETSLSAVHPYIVKEWHPTKNGKLLPDDFLPMSSKRIWWICQNGHEWLAKIADRSKGTKCPYCMNRRVCDDNCLQTTYPSIANQWHPLKNGNFTPRDFTAGSEYKAWWICEKGHEWQAKIFNRKHGRSCPHCK